MTTSLRTAKGQELSWQRGSASWLILVPAAAFCATFLFPRQLLANDALSELLEGDLLSLAVFLLVPTLLVAISAFAKVSVVLAILRNAFGSNEIPPAILSTALALVLSVIVLLPVLREVGVAYLDETTQPTSPIEAEDLPQQTVEPGEQEDAGPPPDEARLAETQESDPAKHSTTTEQRVSPEQWARVWTRAMLPIEAYLEANSETQNVARFEALLAPRIAPEQPEAKLAVLVPAYLVTELSEAFFLGLLLLLPFVVVDLLVSALLQASGLGALQPHVVALPMKLLLFLSIDGWRLLFETLLGSYA
ncbi:MAG: hypothetical protein RBU37_14205 [Myxococcota bacterium]|jgi:type III secretion protein R|nr:hypothetical protein [Myxococcota bacterium]